MLNCTLNGKKYTVPFVSGRVLREIDDALEVYTKLLDATMKIQKGEKIEDMETFSVAGAMDVMVEWFCLLFHNQFTPDEVYDGYPADSLLHDISFAIQAVNSRMTMVLSDFPMKAAQEIPETEKP